MADVGDSYTIETSVTDDGGAPFDPALVSLTVTDPAGATTSPVVANPTPGTYSAVVTLDQAGRWLYKWTTVGPDGVDWGYVDVLADPPARSFALATVADLEARVGPLTPEQATRAVALLEDASAFVRDDTGQHFDAVSADVTIIRAVGATLVLPRRPVTAVTSVTAIGCDGGDDRVLVQGTEWCWDGLDRLTLTPGIGSDTYRVTYDHGRIPIPVAVKAVVCGMVNRVLTSPTLTEGVTQETIGQYTVQWQQATASGGTQVNYTDGDRYKLRRWRTESASVAMVLG